MKKTKVLYVITKSAWGGAQRYVFDLATNLPKDQFDVAVVAGGEGALTEKLGAAGVKVVTLPTLQKSNGFFDVVFSPFNFKALFTLLALFKKERPDIVHLNSSKIGGLGAVAAFLYKTLNPKPETLNPRVIFTVHGWGFNESRPRWQRVAIFFFSWLAARFQHCLVHVAQNDFEATLRRRIASRKNAVHIPLGIAEQNFLSRNRARAFLSKKYGVADNALVVGIVAELTKNKGLTHLLDAIKQVKLQITNYKLQTIIIGEGEERENLQNQIRALGLEDTVHLAGFIPDAAKYLKAFDVFILPSLKEGLPYTILEAMHAGLPIVASNVGGISDVIEHEKNGILVPPKDPKALADAIISMLAKPLASPQKRFSLEEMVEKTASLYSDVINE